MSSPGTFYIKTFKFAYTCAHGNKKLNLEAGLQLLGRQMASKIIGLNLLKNIMCILNDALIIVIKCNYNNENCKDNLSW